jgi:hypothetical protein
MLMSKFSMLIPFFLYILSHILVTSLVQNAEKNKKTFGTPFALKN